MSVWTLSSFSWKRYWSHLRFRLQRITQLDGVRFLDESRDELVLDPVVDDQARTGDTCLAGGGEDACHDAVGGGIHIGIVEQDVGGLAAEL